MRSNYIPGLRQWCFASFMFTAFFAGDLLAREVLIRNVKVLDPSGEKEPQTVTIQVVDDQLRLVSTKPIPAAEGAEVIDGQKPSLPSSSPLGHCCKRHPRPEQGAEHSP